MYVCNRLLIWELSQQACTPRWRFQSFKKCSRSSTYFEKCKKEIRHGFALFQLQQATRWTHLHKTLGQIFGKKEHTDDEIQHMALGQKSELIQNDPVTCTRNLDRMAQLFIRDVSKSNVAAMGKVADYLYRVEFQQRRSPHIHGLFWIKELHHSMKHISSNEEVVTFLDRFIICSKPNISSEMENLQCQFANA